MSTHTVRFVPVAGVMAAASLLALAGCAGHSSAAHTSSSPPTPARGTGTHPAILTSSPPSSTSSSGLGTVTTTGTATVNGAPDTMTVSLRVSTTNLHAAAALAHNNTLTLAVQRALEQDGVAAEDIQTTGLSLQQNYAPGPAGFEADDEVTATLHNLARAGSAIDDAIGAAGDAGRLDSVNFSVSDTSPLMAAARQQAVAAARTDAAELAAAAGGNLGDLRSLTDETQPASPSQYLGAPQAGSSATSVPTAVPVQPGTQQLSVVVTAVWDVSR